VNVAARLQAYAEPGGIVVSGAVAEQIGSGFGLGAIDLGDLHLRNLARPVRVFALRVSDGAAAARRRCAGRLRAAALHRGAAFRKHQTDPEENYFADGSVDVIINALASLRNCSYLARLDPRLFRPQRLTRARSAATSGTLRAVWKRTPLARPDQDRDGTQRHRDRHDRRSDQYDGDLAELFEVQDRIATNVVQDDCSECA